MGEQFYTDATGQMSASFPNQSRGAMEGVPCTIRDATAIARQSVYWRLKKHPNLIAANIISLWPSHGSRWPVSMRQ